MIVGVAIVGPQVRSGLLRAVACSPACAGSWACIEHGGTGPCPTACARRAAQNQPLYLRHFTHPGDEEHLLHLSHVVHCALDAVEERGAWCWKHGGTHPPARCCCASVPPLARTPACSPAEEGARRHVLGPVHGPAVPHAALQGLRVRARHAAPLSRPTPTPCACSGCCYTRPACLPPPAALRGSGSTMRCHHLSAPAIPPGTSPTLPPSSSSCWTTTHPAGRTSLQRWALWLLQRRTVHCLCQAACHARRPAPRAPHAALPLAPCPSLAGLQEDALHVCGRHLQPVP